ncbi:MAG: DivIVA domain-containing protein [Firmicutes bacterium]|nr:DivIVA domain-containing protein [Bacillota bacterium]
MTLTPLDIHNKEFKTVLRGYDRNEVDEFLDLIIKDLEQIFKESAELKDRNQTLQEQLEHNHDLELTLHNALVVAQETAEEVKASAKREAQLIIREAEMKAERLVDEAIAKVRRMTAELDEMRKQAAVFRSRLVNLLKAQLEMLDSEDWEELESAAGSALD